MAVIARPKKHRIEMAKRICMTALRRITRCIDFVQLIRLACGDLVDIGEGADEASMNQVRASAKKGFST
jgi:hypothetical protein